MSVYLYLFVSLSICLSGHVCLSLYLFWGLFVSHLPTELLPQETEVAAGHNSGKLTIWDITNGKRKMTRINHVSSITDIAFSTIKNNLVVTSCMFFMFSTIKNNLVVTSCMLSIVYFFISLHA